MKSKQHKQKSFASENKNSPKQFQSAKSLPAPNNGINFTIQQKQAPVKNTTGIPNNLKSGIEHLSGIDISDVKVHYNSAQPAQLNAYAFAQGNQIHVAPGQEKHLPHEAWHVVQQKQGRVKPTKQLKGKVNINDDEGLEKEADVMGMKALQFFKIELNDLTTKQLKPKESFQGDLLLYVKNSHVITQLVKENANAIPVPQGMVLLHKAERPEDAIKTIGVGPCVALAIRVVGEEPPLICLAHFDSTTNPNSVLDIVDYIKNELGVNFVASNLHAAVWCGIVEGTELFVAIISKLRESGVTINLEKIQGQPINVEMNATASQGKMGIKAVEIDRDIGPRERALAEIRETHLIPLTPTESRHELIETGLKLCQRLLAILEGYVDWYNKLPPEDQHFAKINFDIAVAKIDLAYHYSQKLDVDLRFLKQIVLDLQESIGVIKSTN